MGQKFKLDEIVIFNSKNPKVMEVNNEKGRIRGVAYDDNKQMYLYGVMHIASGIVYSAYESELIKTGEFYSEEQWDDE